MSLFLAAVMLIVIIGGVIAFVALFGHTRGTAAQGDTTQRLVNAQAALEQFASASGRLPCPADPALDTGDEDATGASFSCNSPSGTLPWRAIGLAHDSQYDAWGWKISYRVYTGAAGSLTQPNGASMVLCTNVYSSVSAGVGAGGVCQVDASGNHTWDTDYLAGKGLTVSDFGAAHTDVAYVLVSHGGSGLGAYSSAGQRKVLPANADELGNTTATGPFMAHAQSSPDVAPDDANHFDDVLAYRSLSDFMVHANLAARAWPSLASLVGYTMNSATVGAALGTTPSPGDVGTNRILFGSGTDRARVRGFEGGVNTDLAFDTSGGSESLGVAGSGGITFLSSARSDKIRIDFNQDVFQLGVALADFGTSTVGATTQVEQAQFTFSRGTSGAGSITVIKQACRADGGLATFSINPGIDFERVEITPLDASPSGTTQFGVADFQACGPGTGVCLSALAGLNTPCP